MESNKFKITCVECGANRMVGIIKHQGRYIIDWFDNHPDPDLVKILSGRRRMDDNWGWQCICGNDDILTNQEKEHITNKQNPDPMEIAALAKSLIPEKPKFNMERI